VLADDSRDHRFATHGEIVGVTDEVPELEALAALVRCAQPESVRPVQGPVPVGEPSHDELVIVFRPRSRDVFRSGS